MLVIKATRGEAGEHQVCMHGIGGVDPAQFLHFVSTATMCACSSTQAALMPMLTCSGYGLPSAVADGGQWKQLRWPHVWSPDHPAVLAGPADER